jgi:hypothetical protein
MGLQSEIYLACGNRTVFAAIGKIGLTASDAEGGFHDTLFMESLRVQARRTRPTSQLQSIGYQHK